jgi:Do/DeqQ family serine protease
MTFLARFPAPLVALVSLGGLSVALAAPDTKAKVPVKENIPGLVAKPALTVDPTPVTEGKRPEIVSYADVVAPVQKAVVSIYSTKTVRQAARVDPLLRQFFGEIPDRESKEEGLGSGVIVTGDGYILTNNHVIEGADQLRVSLSDDREFKAKLVGADPKTDVAVIKIDAEKLPSITLADSDKLRVGDIVFAIGNPLDVGQTVTMGIVSATSRSVGILEEVAGYESFIQTDAAINQGNSGGALVDAKGRLVGINSAILSTSRGNIGIGFAIPVNMASAIMTSLITTGTVARGYLGVESAPLTPELAEGFGLKKGTKGVIIMDVRPNSPALAAGLVRGDVVTAVNDQPVSSVEDLRMAVAQKAPESEVTLKTLRDAKERVVKVTLGKLTDSAELLPGVEVGRLSDEQRRQMGLPRNVEGLVITKVSRGSPLSR